MIKKKWFVGAIILICIVAIIIGGIFIMEQRAEKVELQEKKEQERIALADSYFYQNQALNYYSKKEYIPPRYERNSPFYGLYFDLAYYEKTTEFELSYEQIYDYLSCEFEDDGEIRIYNNGKHREIENYVEWFKEHKEDCDRYNAIIISIMSEYLSNYSVSYEIDDFFRNATVMDELIKKEADPNYVMDERIMWEGLPYGPYADEASE